MEYLNINFIKYRKKKIRGWRHQNQEKEEEVSVECPYKVATDQPCCQVSSAVAQVRTGEGLPADGGRVHQKLGTIETIRREQGKGKTQGRRDERYTNDCWNP